LPSARWGSLAVAVMTIALLLILVVPLYLGITTIVENANRIVDWSKSLETLAVPQPPYGRPRKSILPTSTPLWRRML